MEPLFAIAFGVMMATSAYLLMSRHLLRIILGMMLLSNGVNLSIFLCGRSNGMQPPILEESGSIASTMANPLPQALILTAIVISFALMIFAATLYRMAFDAMGTVDTEAINDADADVTGNVTQSSQEGLR